MPISLRQLRQTHFTGEINYEVNIYCCCLRVASRYAELEARITFKSDQPVSFCSTIEFRDDRALAVCYLTVYATADNTSLTTYMYPMRSSVFDDTCATTSVLHPSISSNGGMDDSDDYERNGQRISRTFRRVCPRFLTLPISSA